MSKNNLSPQVIEAFNNAIEMFDKFSTVYNVCITGTIAMMNKGEKGDIQEGTTIKNFIYNKPK